jgi:uncharacterized protein YdeI (YjbR/CyaY-like superfamily)
MKRDPRIDVYIETVPDYALPIFAHLRPLLHKTIPEGAETLKWGKPAFTYRDKNVATFAAFKHHAMFVIHGDGRQGESELDSGKLTGVGDLPGDNTIVDRLVAACERIDAEGTAVRKKPASARKPKPEIPVPDDFAAALSANGAAATTFEALAPSHRRDYLEWIVEAKREETRTKRVAQAVAQLAEGKKRHWQYEKC